MKMRVIAGTALTLIASVALSAEASLPLHKAGLWQNDMLVAGKHTSNQQCFDNASQIKMLALSKQRCSEHHVVHNTNGSWTTTGVCQFGAGATQKSRSDISGDFNSKLTIATQSTGQTTLQSTITSTRLGDCKPDQRGGDVITSSGAKVNMIDVMSAPAAGH